MARMFFGWRVVAAAVTVFAYGDAVYGLGVWLHVLTAERGWSVAFVSACVTLHFLASRRDLPPPSALAFGAGTAAQVGLFSHLFSMAAPALGPQDGSSSPTLTAVARRRGASSCRPTAT